MRNDLTALSWQGETIHMEFVRSGGWEAVEKSTGGMGGLDLVRAVTSLNPAAVRAIFEVAAPHIDFDDASNDQPFARLARSALAPILLSFYGHREVTAANVVDALRHPFGEPRRGRD